MPGCSVPLPASGRARGSLARRRRGRRRKRSAAPVVPERRAKGRVRRRNLSAVRRLGGRRALGARSGRCLCRSCSRGRLRQSGVDRSQAGLLRVVDAPLVNGGASSGDGRGCRRHVDRGSRGATASEQSASGVPRSGRSRQREIAPDSRPFRFWRSLAGHRSNTKFALGLTFLQPAGLAPHREPPRIPWRFDPCQSGTAVAHKPA